MGNEWAGQAAAKLRERLDIKLAREARLLHEQQLREKEGPLLWNDVRRLVKEKCTDLNRAYGQNIATFEIVPSTEMRVLMDVPDTGHRELTAHFYPGMSAGAMSWGAHRSDSADVKSGEYVLGIADDHAVFQTPAHTLETPESIAERMLDSLVEP